MNYYIPKEVTLKWLETPCVYHITHDELYELDRDSFAFLKRCYAGCSSQDKEFIEYCLKEGLLTSERVTPKKPPLIQSPTPSLRYLELQITDRCNLRCKHCYINPPSLPLKKGGLGGFSEENLSELSFKQIRNVLREFEKMQGLRVLITGGEPLLHSRFDEINEILPLFSLRKVLFTNGLLLNKERITKLNVNEVQISIDGLEEAHDSLRGKGTFSMAIEAIRLSIDHGLPVSIATMVHPENLRDFKEMERLFREMGVREWTVDVPCVTGRLKENEEFQISYEEGGGYLRYGYGGGLHTSSPGFACGLHLMAVMADGKVAKCTFYADRPVGRIEEGLQICWQRIKPIELGKLKCDCDYIESCRGGCRYRAELLGDPFGKDLYRCALYGIMVNQ